MIDTIENRALQRTHSIGGIPESRISSDVVGASNKNEVCLAKIADPATICSTAQARSHFANKALQRYVSANDAADIQAYANNTKYHKSYDRAPDCRFVIDCVVALEAVRTTPGVELEADFQSAHMRLQKLVKGVADGSKTRVANDDTRAHKMGQDVKDRITKLVQKDPEALFARVDEMLDNEYLRNGVPKAVENRYEIKLPLGAASAFSAAGDGYAAANSVLAAQLKDNVTRANTDSLAAFVNNRLVKIDLGRDLKKDASAKKPSRSTSEEVGVSGRDKADRGASSGNSQAVVTNNIGQVDTSAAFAQAMTVFVDGVHRIIADKDRIVAEKDKKIEAAHRREIALLKQLLTVRNLNSPSALNTRRPEADTPVVATVVRPHPAMPPVQRTQLQQRDDNDPAVIVQTSGSGLRAVAEQPSEESVETNSDSRPRWPSSVMVELRGALERGVNLKPASDRGPRFKPEDPITELAQAMARFKPTSTINGSAQVDTGWSRNSADTSFEVGRGNSSASLNFSDRATTPEISTTNPIEPSPDQGDGDKLLDLKKLTAKRLADKGFWDERREQAIASAAATAASHAPSADAETGKITTVQHASNEATAERSAGPAIGANVDDISELEEASVVPTLEERLSWQLWNKLPTVGVTESEQTDSNIDEDPPEAPPALTPTTRLNSPSRKIEHFEEQAGGGRRVFAVNTPLAPHLSNLRDSGTTSRAVLPGGQTDSSSAATNNDLLTDIRKARGNLKPSKTAYSGAREALVRSSTSADTASNVGRDNMAALADRSSSATTPDIGTSADAMGMDQAQNLERSDSLSELSRLPSMVPFKLRPAKVHPTVDPSNSFSGSAGSFNYKTGPL